MRLSCGILLILCATAACAQPNIETHRAKLLTFLHGEYARLLASEDWVTRALAVISMARLPDVPGTGALLDTLEKDKHPVVKMLAWQAVLSRASLLEAVEHERWIKATVAMKGNFAGPLRLGLVRAIGSGLPSKEAKELFMALFEAVKTDTPENLALLEELGRTLVQWKSAELVNTLIAKTGRAVDAPRVGAVLKPAGFNGPARLGVPVFKKWWDGERGKWVERTTLDDKPWRTLSPQLLPNVLDAASIDPNEKTWRNELEIGRPELRSFDVAFAVDISTSMNSALEWLRRDLNSMLSVLSIFTREPRIGITFFDCVHGQFGVQTIALSSDIEPLTAALKKMRVGGGGEELVHDGLVEVIEKSFWPGDKGSIKVIILVSDEGVATRQLPKCRQLVTKASGDGFRFYALSPDTQIPWSHKVLSELGNGKAFAMNLRGERPPATGPSTQPAQTGTREILLQIVTDALNPEYRDRAAPLVDIVLMMREVLTGK